MKASDRLHNLSRSDVFAEACQRGLIAERSDIPNRLVALPDPIEDEAPAAHRPSTREIIAWARADAHRQPLWDDLAPHGAPRAAVEMKKPAPTRPVGLALAGPIAFGLIGLATMAFVAV